MPQPEVLENLLNDQWVVGQSDDAHLVAALRALQGAHLVHAIHQLGPGGPGAAPDVGVRLSHLDGGLLGSVRRVVFGPIAAAVGPIVTDRMFVLVGDVLD